MAIDPKSFENKSMVEYVEKALEAMKEDLTEKDWGVIGGIRTMAEYCDETRHTVRAMDLEGTAEDREKIRAMELHNKAVYTIPHIIAGLERLGGSIASRKRLGQAPDAPKKSGLAAVRSIRDAAGQG